MVFVMILRTLAESNLETSLGVAMSEAFYVSRSTIEKVGGVHRRARLEAGAVIDFGVHGTIKKHYKLDDQPDLPLPVDFMAAAAGA